MIRKNNPTIPHDKLRLHSSERTISWGENVFNQFISSIQDTDIRYYPNLNELRDRLKEFYNISPTSDLMLGAGSDRCNKYFFEMFKGRHIVLSDPCFGMYDVYADMMDMEFTKIPYLWGKFNVNGILNNLKDDSVIVISNPSSPIGDVIHRCDLIRILNRGLPTLIDEAYIEFSDEVSIVELMDEYDNLYVTRTLSKAFGSAGVRVGVIISNENNITHMTKYRDMYEISGLSLRWTETMLNNTESIHSYIQDVRNTKSRLVSKLLENGYDVVDSQSNWIHIRRADMVDLPNDIVFRTNCKVPPHDGVDWIRLQVSDNINDYKFLF